MHLTVFGATGGIGGHVVRQALTAGHRVTAVIRQGSRLDLTHPSLEIVAVPGLADPGPLHATLRDTDAAISGVGPRSRKDTTVASTATRGILRALQDCGVRRFAAVTAAPVGPDPAGESLTNRLVLLPLIRALLRPIYADLAVAEAEIAASDTDWTIVRPPRLTDKPLSGRYRVRVGANVPRARTISRADVAHAMLAALTDPATIRQPLGVAN